MEKSSWIKHLLVGLVLTHLIEAFITCHVARRRGKDPVKYFFKGLCLGVFVLVPLLREPVDGEIASS